MSDLWLYYLNNNLFVIGCQIQEAHWLQEEETPPPDKETTLSPPPTDFAQRLNCGGWVMNPEELLFQLYSTRVIIQQSLVYLLHSVSNTKPRPEGQAFNSVTGWCSFHGWRTFPIPWWSPVKPIWCQLKTPLHEVHWKRRVLSKQSDIAGNQQ